MLSKERQEELMRVVINEVDEAIKERDNPFACILVDCAGNMLCKARNKQNTTKDRTAHAEIVLIRDATRKLNKNKLNGFAVMSSTEPCSMCTSALIKAGINTIYYGAPMDKGNNPFIRVEEIAKKSNFLVTTVGGILSEECISQVFKIRRESI